MERGERLFEQEEIDDTTHYNDAITVALRTKEGLDLTTLQVDQRDYCMANAKRHIDAKLLKTENNHLVLTKEGLFVSDMIMSDLMIV